MKEECVIFCPAQVKAPNFCIVVPDFMVGRFFQCSSGFVDVAHILFTEDGPTLHQGYLKFIEFFSQYAKVHGVSNGGILYVFQGVILCSITGSGLI